MTSYPIHVGPLQPYTGREPRLVRKYHVDARRAHEIAGYINRKIEAEFQGRATAVFSFDEIALALNMELKAVQEYLQQCGGGVGNRMIIEIPRPDEAGSSHA
jgi:hypothetical protein